MSGSTLTFNSIMSNNKLKENASFLLSPPSNSYDGDLYCTSSSTSFYSFPSCSHTGISSTIFRDDKFKKIFYMSFCNLEQATHFYIVNYD